MNLQVDFQILFLAEALRTVGAPKGLRAEMNVHVRLKPYSPVEDLATPLNFAGEGVPQCAVFDLSCISLR